MKSAVAFAGLGLVLITFGTVQCMPTASRTLDAPSVALTGDRTLDDLNREAETFIRRAGSRGTLDGVVGNLKHVREYARTNPGAASRARVSMAELAQCALVGAAAGGHAAFIDRFPANIKITRATVHRMLEQAAAYGHVDVVNKMLALDYTDEGLELAAQAAVKYDQSQVIDALITVKATAHVARAAAEYGNLPALEKAHAAANSSPSNSDMVFEEYAVFAASNGHRNVISWVFCTVDKIEVNVDYTPAIILAIEAGHVDIAHALITRVKRPNLKTRLMLYAEALGSSSIGNSVLTSLAAANVLPPRSLRACLDAIKMNPSNVFPAALCNHGEFSDEFKDDLLEATVLLMAKLKHYTQIKLLIRAEPGVEYMVPGVVGMIGVLHGDGELISVLTGDYA